MKKILVVDDDHSIRIVLKEALLKQNYSVDVAAEPNEAINLLDENIYDLIISDLVMPNMNGLELMDYVKNRIPDTGFLIITAYGSIEKAVEAMHNGAFDFVTKPFSVAQLKSRIDRYFSFRKLERENRVLQKKLTRQNSGKLLVGNSPAMQIVRNQIEMVAQSDVPVFIEGESGTGKELIAQAIHENCDRSKQPFIKVNCAAIPETLFESTLFGHEKGSFTNAIRTTKGLFEEAHGGTFLLDEISEIPISMQAKLLRVLQEWTITRVGSTKEVPIDVRVIATTNRNIKKMIEEGKFRDDLYFRLNVIPIKVPPVRSRKEDIPLLIEHFIRKFQKKYKFKEKYVDSDTMKVLMQYKWPGNVRQIENLVERAILYSGHGTVINLEHFSMDTDLPSKSLIVGNAPVSIAEMERELIFNTLKYTKYNRTKAAEILDISVRTLRNKLHEYEEAGIEIPKPK